MTVFKNRTFFFFPTAIFFFTLFLLFCVFNTTNASKIDELKSKIDDRGAKIEELQKEIDEYNKKIDEAQKEKNTLGNAVKILEITGKKLSADIKLTQNKIDSATLKIGGLELEIDDKQKRIELENSAISESIRKMEETDAFSLVEIILSQNQISDFWKTIQNLEEFQTGMRDDLKELQILKKGLAEKKIDEQDKKRELVNLKTILSDQKKVVEYNKKEKNELLKQTQNKEANYKNLLEEKKTLKEQFEREMLELESELKITIDPNSLPQPSAGILGWPLEKIFITQYFGDTPFSKSGAYDGRGHNGVDFRASVGTKVTASLGGTVESVGDTDIYRGCYSYGKWVLIRHRNGLSTLYAHLSLIKAWPGQEVNIGDIIGYSGNTGYSTGPHLHLTVYATQGVKVIRLGDVKKMTNCGEARIPIAPLNAYLNPLEYLPKI